MMTMTMRLKFAGAGFTDIFWEPLNVMGGLNLKAAGNVLEDRTRLAQEIGLQDFARPGFEGKTLRLRAGQAAGNRDGGSGVERDGLAEMLEEMSLSTLLYYVLAGDGRERDESC